MVCLVITQAFALSAPQLLRIATDGVPARESSKVFQAAGALIAVAVLGGLARIASRILIFNSGRLVEYDIRNDCFSHLESVEPAFYQRLPLGQVMSRLVNDLYPSPAPPRPRNPNLTNTLLAYMVAILSSSGRMLGSPSTPCRPCLVLLARPAICSAHATYTARPRIGWARSPRRCREPERNDDGPSLSPRDG